MDYPSMSNAYVFKNLVLWKIAAEREIKNHNQVYHYYLDRELGHPDKNTAYSSIEDWKKDINKLLIKNI